MPRTPRAVVKKVAAKKRAARKKLAAKRKTAPRVRQVRVDSQIEARVNRKMKEREKKEPKILDSFDGNWTPREIPDDFLVNGSDPDPFHREEFKMLILSNDKTIPENIRVSGRTRKNYVVNISEIGDGEVSTSFSDGKIGLEEIKLRFDHATSVYRIRTLYNQPAWRGIPTSALVSWPTLKTWLAPRVQSSSKGELDRVSKDRPLMLTSDLSIPGITFGGYYEPYRKALSELGMPLYEKDKRYNWARKDCPFFFSWNGEESVYEDLINNLTISQEEFIEDWKTSLTTILDKKIKSLTSDLDTHRNRVFAVQTQLGELKFLKESSSNAADGTVSKMIDDIRATPGVLKVEYSPRGLLVYTDEIWSHRDNDETNPRLYLGKFVILIGVKPETGIYFRNLAGPHPTFQHGHSYYIERVNHQEPGVCQGGFKDVLAKAQGALDYYSVFLTAFEFIRLVDNDFRDKFFPTKKPEKGYEFDIWITLMPGRQSGLKLEEGKTAARARNRDEDEDDEDEDDDE